MFVFLLSLLLTLSLCACSNIDTTYNIERGGETFEINTEDGTIFDGTNTYKYVFSGNSSSYDIDITYPNGSAYYWSQNGSMGHGGWSDDYNEVLYVSGDILCDVVAAKAPKASNPTKIFAVIFLIFLGAFDVLFPKISWVLAYGWRYKNAEPSDIALGLIRVGGIIVIIISIVLIFA